MLKLNRETVAESARYLLLLALAAVAAACGGGGGDDGSRTLDYVGNRDRAVITADNMGTMAADIMITSGLGYVVGGGIQRGGQPATSAPTQSSLTGLALQVRKFARRSLQNTGTSFSGPVARFSARTSIDETENCESGSSRITGVIEDDLTGEVEIDFRQCRYARNTIDGKLIWTIRAIDQFRLLPTQSTLQFESLTVSSPMISSTIGGSIDNLLDFSTNSEILELRDMVVRDNVTGRHYMASSLRLLFRYDDIEFPAWVDIDYQSGRVFDSTHGYVDVKSLQSLHYDNIDDSFPSGGKLQLTGVGRLLVTAVPNLFVLLSLDTDDPPDGEAEFNVIRSWDSIEDPGPIADKDLDDDGIDDQWELNNGLDPFDAADALLDFEFDGFDNLTEHLAGTDPNDPASMPPFSNLWRPAPGSTPQSGSFVYLESQAGDYIGAGSTYLYTEANASLSAIAGVARLQVTVSYSGSWSGTFQLPAALSQLEPGYHGQLRRYPFHEAADGGLSWTGNGRGCNMLTGWFVIDDVTYQGDQLQSVDLRFGQHCENKRAALRGKIHWVKAPPPPPPPPPTDLWQPAPGATPGSGTYIYLESQPGDYIGQGGEYLYTRADAILNFTTTGGRLGVSVDGDESWNGNFQSPNTLSRLEPGLYYNLERYPFHDQATGGLSWSGEGRGCNTLTGWFVVDNVSYDSDTLTAVDLRFEQACGGSSAVLNGKLHWEAGDTTSPPGPVDPPPAGLWQAPEDATPVSGNYVYLESEASDYIGQGSTYLYTDADSTLSVDNISARVSVVVEGDESWNAVFQAMYTLPQLEPGYYGNLQRFPFHNPARGGLSWGGEGRGCNRLTGWFVIDSITYDGLALKAVELRFEQHCEGLVPALHGQIRWNQ